MADAALSLVFCQVMAYCVVVVVVVNYDDVVDVVVGFFQVKTTT